MITRAYLSIGDVLTLLREEFPDVTISKIRFLESQGLVNPERSPSGYRKFYEQDVERLRWVLRQQREHFLPLKVIRDRLAQEGGEAVPDDEPTAAVATAVRPAEPEPAVRLAAAPEVEREDRENGLEPSSPATRPVLARSVGTGGEGATPPSAPARPTPEPRSPILFTAAGLEGRRADPPAAHAGPPEPAPAVPPAPRAVPPPPPPLPPPTPPVPERAAVPAPPPVAAAEPRPAPPAHKAPPPAPERPSTGVSGASFTLDELAAASGLPAAEVASLEGFGLIGGLPVAGVLYYDEDALVVAKLVAEFGRYGIEPRHLRLFRNAVERELGLIEQIVTPLLRQRNPEARQRAVDASADLSRLGEALRASLLHRELRGLLGH